MGGDWAKSRKKGEKMKRVSKITEQLWRKIKAADKTCKDDAPTAKKFGIGVSTACRIRKTESYDEYVFKYAGNHDKKPKIEVLDDEHDDIIDEIGVAKLELITDIDDATRKLGWLMLLVGLAVVIALLIFK